MRGSVIEARINDSLSEENKKLGSVTPEFAVTHAMGGFVILHNNAPCHAALQPGLSASAVRPGSLSLSVLPR